ncbi:frdC [Acrasis kona]|uniref:FrdC n=1 Tax=Acrasis kona TaxID=1008807 RepID=A0AAW2YIC8_9EUKA
MQSNTSWLKNNIRRYHNILSIFVFAPLLLTVVTGVVYQIGRLWLGLSKENLTILMKLHQMSILGKTSKALYSPILGYFTFYMIFSGIYMVFKRPILSTFALKGKWSTFRGFHRNMSNLILFPFLITALSGTLYRMLKTWFGLEKESVGFLLNWHQGKFISGLGIEYVYPVLLGIAAMASIGAGLTMNKTVVGMKKKATETSLPS